MGVQDIRLGVGAVIFRGDDVLLIRRGKPPLEGAWSIPGGAPHFGETLVTAALREVREETGVEAAIGGFLGVYEFLPGPSPDPGWGGHIVIVDYWGEWRSGAVRAGDDAIEAAFVPFYTALTLPSWEATRQAIAAAHRLRVGS